jgi:hypothetical protein
MQKGIISLTVIGLLLICGCKRTGTVGTPDAPQKEVSSPLMELMKAVQKAEADARGKELQAMKADVADAARRVFSSHKIEDFTKDPQSFGNDLQRVHVRDGVFMVTGRNYFWHLTPIVEQGQLRDVLVTASPICAW